MLPLAQISGSGISEAAFYSVVAVLGVVGALVLLLLTLAVIFMRRISRLSKGLAATADAELRTKLLQQSSWWPRFRFRTMMVFVTLVAIGFGMFVMEWNRARRQAQIVDELENGIFYCEAHYRLGMFGTSAIAKLLTEWVHPDFGSTLIGLDLHQDSDEDVPVLSTTESDWRNLTRLKQLQNLRIDLGGSLPPNIERLTRLTNLRRLALSDCKVDENVVESICRLRDLELMEFRDCQLSGEELEPLNNMTKLETLILCRESLSKEGVNIINSLNNIDCIVVPRDAFMIVPHLTPSSNIVLSDDCSQRIFRADKVDSATSRMQWNLGDDADPFRFANPFEPEPTVGPTEQPSSAKESGSPEVDSAASAEFRELLSLIEQTLLVFSDTEDPRSPADIKPFPDNLSIVSGGRQVIPTNNPITDNRPRFRRSGGGFGGGGFGGGGSGFGMSAEEAIEAVRPDTFNTNEDKSAPLTDSITPGDENFNLFGLPTD